MDTFPVSFYEPVAHANGDKGTFMELRMDQGGGERVHTSKLWGDRVSGPS